MSESDLNYKLISWFCSYLSDRKQFVCVINSSSRLLNIDVGIAQGNIFGTLKFILYVNDLVRASNVSNFYLYANDTSAAVTCTNLATDIDNLNEELQIVVEWFKYNCLILIAAKSDFVFFQREKKKFPQGEY